MLLLLTGSGDGTANLIVSNHPAAVFRLNFDLFNNYKFSFTPDYWRIEDPTGRWIDSTIASKAYWWKAFSFYITDQDPFIKNEVKYIFRDLYSWFLVRGMVKGNPPDWHDKFGKINVLAFAKKYFEVPKTLVSFGLAGAEELKGKSVVVKSLSSSLTANKKVLFTTEVDLTRLDPSFPWYLQEKIDSKWDITVFCCADSRFAFRRDRSSLKGIDWRSEQSFDIENQEWELFQLNPQIELSFEALMKDLKVDFGRFDLMSKGVTNEMMFLEFNANGQWVFLDYGKKHGLLEAVTKWLSE